MMFAGKKCKHCVGSDVEICVAGVLIECEAWLTWAGNVSGFCGFDVVFSG